MIQQEPTPQQATAGEPQYNDTYNANALIEHFGDQLRYVKGWGWLAWDGKRWERDAEHRVRELAKTTLQQMTWEASKIEDRQVRGTLLKHLNRSLDYPRLTAMVALAESDERIRARMEDFDRDPMLLNAANGAIDLRTGKLRPHDPADRLTQLTPIEYTPDAPSETWEQFILETAAGRDDLRNYLQAALGYTLTGLTSEKVFFLCFGAQGDNGKSTLLEAVLYVMGEYGLAVAPETILSKNGVSGDQTRDNVNLQGKRYVIAVEPDEGTQFRMGRIKQLTGSDTLPARKLYREAFHFQPALKLWLAANNRPNVPESGNAAWARVKMIPFDNHVPKEQQDKDLKYKLQEAAPAILAWMVQGCLRWQKDGLQEPECMREAQADYRADQDPFQAFLDECCEPDPDASTPLKDVLERYTTWQYQNPDAPALSRKTIRPAFESHGYKTKRVNGWHVLGIRGKRPADSPIPQPRQYASHRQEDGDEIPF